jgi:GNAT superfamily N-acetyltransferase
MEDREWLKSMFRKELDLRPPSLANIGDNSIFIRDDSGIPIAHATLSRRGGSFEINSVVVDPQHRGQGLSRELLELADQSSRRLFAYTRDPRMKSALLRAGYTPARSPGFRPSLNLMVTRPAIFLWMILTLDVKRLVYMSRHMFAYKLYVRR